MKTIERDDPGANDIPVCLEDFRALAQMRLPPDIFDYIDCGAGNEITRHANQCDLDNIRLRPLCLRDVAAPSLSIDLLGQAFCSPIGFSPTAFHRLVHADGEIATAKAAKTLGAPMIVSCMSSLTLEEVAKGSGNDNLWLQTYIFKDREVTLRLIQRAEHSGYKAIVVTLGCPVAGRRDKNIRNRFSLPQGIVAANFKQRDVVVHNNPIHSIEGAELDASLTWKDIEWLRGNVRLPIVLKGIMTPLDIPPALDLQIGGLIVSNHGGRQLDTTESTIRVLPEIAATVAGRLPLLVDSGFRRGTDILKALALGADAVFLGRPVLWALALGGEIGIIGAVNLLLEELRIAMQIAGCASIEEIRSNSLHIISRRQSATLPPWSEAMCITQK